MFVRRAALGRATEVALVAAFLALSAFAYGAFFIQAGEVMTTSVPTEFSDFYRSGQNPWSGAIIEPTPPQDRLAGRAPARFGYR